MSIGWGRVSESEGDGGHWGEGKGGIRMGVRLQGGIRLSGEGERFEKEMKVGSGEERGEGEGNYRAESEGESERGIIQCATRSRRALVNPISCGLSGSAHL